MNQFLFIGGVYDGKRLNTDKKPVIKTIGRDSLRVGGMIEETYRLERMVSGKTEISVYLHESILIDDIFTHILANYKPQTITSISEFQRLQP